MQNNNYRKPNRHGFNNDKHRGGNHERKFEPKQPKVDYNIGPTRRVKNVDPMSNPATMGKEAIRIFLDMARGNGRPIDQYSMFSNRDFLSAASKEVTHKISEANIIYTALVTTYGGAAQNQQIEYLIRKHLAAYNAWTFIYNTLGYMWQTGDMSYVATLMNRLPDYRQVLH